MSSPLGLNAPNLRVHLCELRSGSESWSATIAVEGPPEAVGLTVAVFYEGRRVSLDHLDEWGYMTVEIDELPAPRDLTAQTYFEIRIKRPPAAYTSSAFHPPLVSGALLSYLERQRAWPRDLSLRGAQLQGASLGQSDLKGVDFTGADFTGAKLWRADLTGAILRGAKLDEVDFTGAQLSCADLQGACAEGATWDEVELKGADLRELVGATSTLLLTWGHSVTLDDAQQARLKLLGLSQRDPTSSHYVGLNQTSESDTSSPSHRHLASTDLSPRSVSRRTSYDSGEHTFYRSPTPRERSQAQEEEAPPYAPILPAPETISPEDRMVWHQREASRFQRQLSKYQQQRRLRNGIEFKLNMIPNGTFIMGSDEGDAKIRPRHKVTLSYPLLVGETLVTQELFSYVMGPHKFKFDGEDLPAESLSWNEAIEFCNRLSRLERLSPAYSLSGQGISWVRESNGYRLPTEAEWEYFARANTPYSYAGGDALDDVAWFKDNAKNKPHPVAQKSPNAWGLYDVSGNLWEWCFDTYQEGAYHKRGVEPTLDPVVEAEGPKVIRGGSWSYEEEGLRVHYRSRLAAKFKTSRIGLRLVRSPKLKSRDS